MLTFDPKPSVVIAESGQSTGSGTAFHVECGETRVSLKSGEQDGFQRRITGHF
jgi:hypothetical protein